MSDISRKALEDTLNNLYNQQMAAGAYRVAIDDVKAGIESIPSTESEGEADQYDLQMTAELGRLARENGRLRAALELIKRNELFEHMRKTSTWKIANEILSYHREDADTVEQKLQALYEKHVGSDDRKTRGIALGVKLASEALGIYISNGGQSNE